MMMGVFLQVRIMSQTLFEKIIAGDIPGDIVYEDELCVAFRDINPGAPLHVLLVPRKPIPMLSKAEEQDAGTLGHLLQTAPKIAAQEGYADAFRLVINNGEEVGQTVFHLHLHILGGRAMAWPPG